MLGDDPKRPAMFRSSAISTALRLRGRDDQTTPLLSSPSSLTDDDWLRRPPPPPPPPPRLEGVPPAMEAVQRMEAHLRPYVQKVALEDLLVDLEHATNAPTPAEKTAVLDFSLIAIYLLGLQQTFGVALAALVSVVAPLLLPQDGRTPLRTLLLALLAGGAAVVRPLLVDAGRSTATRHALTRLHKTLRLALPIWAMALTAEQLAFSDCAVGADAGAHHLGPIRRLVLVLADVGLLVAAGARLAAPSSTADAPVVLCAGALLLLGLTPQTLGHERAPLAHPLSVADAAVRIARAAAFGGTFAACCLVAAPRDLRGVQPLVLALRGAAASVWLLAVPTPLLLLAPLFVVALAARRVQSGPAADDSTSRAAAMHATQDSSDDDDGDSQGLLKPYVTIRADDIAPLPAAPPPKPAAPPPKPRVPVSHERQAQLLRLVEGADDVGDASPPAPEPTTTGRSSGSGNARPR